MKGIYVCGEYGMARTKYVIALNEEERNTLNRIITEKTESDRTILRSRIQIDD